MPTVEIRVKEMLLATARRNVYKASDHHVLAADFTVCKSGGLRSSLLEKLKCLKKTSRW